MTRRSPLVGRDAEITALRAALERCAGGNGGLVVVSGEAGVGKSRLVTESLEAWPSLVLHSNAVAGSAAYAPLTGLHGAGAEPSTISFPATADPAGIVDAIRRALLRLGDGEPVVVVLEDLQWADSATIDLLPVLAAAWSDEPLLILATYRSDQLPRTHSLRRSRSELRRTGRLNEIPLRPLTRDETGHLLCGILGARVEPSLRDEVHDRSDGLPFFVEELAATLEASPTTDPELPLPDTVVDAVLARTAHLARAHREAVEMAAVLGVRVHLTVLAELVTPEVIDDLLEDGLLVEHDRTGARDTELAAFRHALVQEALYSAIPWGRRRRHHVNVARALAEHGAPPATVAEHWIAAHEFEPARPLLLAAADHSCSLHAYRDAARLTRRALEVWPEDVDPGARISALERLAGCAELCGEHRSAADTWAEVVHLRESTDDLAGVGVANRRLANARELVGDVPAALAARDAAGTAFAAAGAPGDAAEEWLALAEHLWGAAHNTRALEYAVAATTGAEATGRSGLRARAMAMEGGIRATLGEGPRGVALARQGLALAIEEKLPEPAGEAYYQLAAALLYATEYAAAANAYESASELCRENDATDLAQACSACLSVVVRLMGDWDRALSISAAVLDADDSPPPVLMVAQEETALITALRGDRRRARGPLRRAAEFGREHEIFGIEVGALWGLAVVADLDGEDHTARRGAHTLLERCAGKEEWHFALPALRWVSTFLAERGEDAGVAQGHRFLASAATRDSSSKVLSALAHAGGELALAGGDAAQAAMQFGRSVELLHGIPAPYEQALAQLRWGAALAADGHRQGAVDAVSGAYRIARQLGARPLADGCVTRLAEMGEPVDRRLGRLAARALEPGRLTPREKQVLQLLDDGRTNRQIAAELFVSPRTVDMHVRNLLAKLGCTSRLAAVKRGAELGILDVAPRKLRQ
jgi:DNA-binding CsgD family transcriptional regulator